MFFILFSGIISLFVFFNRLDILREKQIRYICDELDIEFPTIKK